MFIIGVPTARMGKNIAGVYCDQKVKGGDTFCVGYSQLDLLVGFPAQEGHCYRGVGPVESHQKCLWGSSTWCVRGH